MCLARSSKKFPSLFINFEEFFFIRLISLLLHFSFLEFDYTTSLKIKSKSVLLLVALSKSINFFISFVLNFSVFAQSLITYS